MGIARRRTLGYKCGMDIETLRTKLVEDRGSYHVIANATGLSHGAIVKMATGFTKRPFGKTLKALTKYYADQEQGA